MDDAEDTPIEASWERIEDWLAENAPFTLLTLNEGATERDIWAAQSALGFALPAEVAESWRIHNGQAESTLISEGRLLSLADVAAEWRQCTAEIPFWNPKWLPLTTDEKGEHFCVDLSEQNDTTPPMLFVRKEGVESLSTNLTAWLQNFASALEAGYYEWLEDFDGLVYA